MGRELSLWDEPEGAWWNATTEPRAEDGVAYAVVPWPGTDRWPHRGDVDTAAERRDRAISHRRSLDPEERGPRIVKGRYVKVAAR